MKIIFKKPVVIPVMISAVFLFSVCSDENSISEENSSFNSELTFQSAQGAGKERTVADSDHDLFPDAAELHTAEDRDIFILWFVRIAESQFKKANTGWNPGERDCSGLIRFAYREALKRHDRKWYEQNGIVLDKNIPDIQKFNYPDIPGIGKNIFKINSAPASDSGSFGPFANAENLMNFNSGFISKNLNDARPGDILFFYDPENFRSAYHSMIVVKNDLQETIILYHTGSEQGIKRVTPGYLSSSRKFYPAVWNKNFLGVFRFHILQ